MIAKVSALMQNLAKTASAKEFNNALPVLLHILKKEGKDLYSIKMGNLTTQTKSQKELTIGAKYFANVARSSVGSILLSQLAPYPKALESLTNATLKMRHEELQNFLAKDAGNFLEEYKGFLLEHFANASNKNEFLFFGNMLLSLQKEVLTLVIQEGGRDSLLQTKRGKEPSELEFYALYPNLGSLSGVVYQKDGGVGLRIQTSFISVQKILQKHASALGYFSQVDILHTPNIEPFFLPQTHLLDLLG